MLLVLDTVPAIVFTEKWILDSALSLSHVFNVLPPWPLANVNLTEVSDPRVANVRRTLVLCG